MSACLGGVLATLRSEALVEELAALEHDRWAHWQRYLHSKCEMHEDGSLSIPAELVQRWTEQAETSYADLNEEEKNSDREQVRRYLLTIATHSSIRMLIHRAGRIRCDAVTAVFPTSMGRRL